MKNVAVVGIQGVPAQYGGFESLVENLIGDHKSEDIRYTVFCSGRDMKSRLAEYKGAELKYVPLRANGVQSIPYDMISFLRIPRKTDVILVLGVSGCLILPVFRLFCRKRMIINIDGLEHRRAKWGKLAKTFLKLSEKMAVRYADVIISDNKGIQDYVREEYGKESELIAYGELLPASPAAELVHKEQQEHKNTGKETHVIIGEDGEEQRNRIKDKFLFLQQPHRAQRHQRQQGRKRGNHDIQNLTQRSS